MENSYRSILEDGITELSLTVSSEKVDCLLAYHELLIKWNKAYNLTAVRNPREMVSRHLLDSLTVAPYLKGNHFIDIGAGAGLPGIVLAILFPERKFDLLDSNGKKTRFLFQVKTELALDNVNVQHCRAEQHVTQHGYDGVLSRAFATLTDMVTSSEHLLADDGLFLAMKGVYPESELKKLSELGKDYTVDACHTLQVPGDSGERRLIVIGRGKQPIKSVER
ncbi:MAG: 16S rRNA (guanine(527)-N(7))-methyltransferase RsmG [Oceanicoccus sp.]